MSFITKGVLKNGLFALMYIWAILMVAHLPLSFNVKLSIWVVLLFLAGLYLRSYKAFIDGGNAEMDVEFLLNDLPKEYSVGSNLVLGQKGNIDMFVVGPTGIWTIEVKSHRTWIKRVSPFIKRCIRQAHAEAHGLRDFIKDRLGKEFKVQPVVVFSRANVRLGPNPIEGVYVIGQAWLKDLIVRAPVSLSPDDMESIKAEIRKQLAAR